MDYEVMCREELESEFNDLLYWLYESGCDCIAFRYGETDAAVHVHIGDVTELAFTSTLPFEK